MILFKTNSLDLNVASIRYRAMLPAMYLKKSGYEVLVAMKLSGNRLPSACRCVVFVKTFNKKDFLLAEEARRRGVPILIDLCDNIFIDGHDGGRSFALRGRFQVMAKLASGVVTTNRALVELIRPMVPADVPVYEIPDQVESEADLQALLADKTAGAESGNLHKNLVAGLVKRGRAVIGKPQARATLSQAGRRKSSQSPSESLSTIVWFGNHGTPNGSFGMLSLLPIIPALSAVYRRIPFKLVVISNSEEKFTNYFSSLPFPAEYRTWRLDRIQEEIRKADLCILPNSRDPFSIVKSANRATLALSLGTPVVATSTPSLEPFASCIKTGDWESGIADYLSDPDLRARDVEVAQGIIRQSFSGESVSQLWSQAIDSAVAREADRTAGRWAERVLVLFNLPQDVEILLPVIRRLVGASSLPPTVVVPGDLAMALPRLLAKLSNSGAYPKFATRSEIRSGRILDGLGSKVVLTASESSLRPHEDCRRLVEAANERGLATFTIQHGLENVGLTYADEIHDASVRFSSGQVLIWGRVEDLPDWVSKETHEKCVSVGCPKDVLDEQSGAELPLGDSPLVTVFENLHWHRYDEDYRTRFLDGLRRAAADYPDLSFVVKPHPSGLWLIDRFSGQLPAADNLKIIDPRDPEWAGFGAAALIKQSLAVITTPSTIALDAARIGVPVGVAGGGIDASRYVPLPVLEAPGHWSDFLQSVLSGRYDESRCADFLQRSICPGDAVDRILCAIQGQSVPQPASELRKPAELSA